MKRIIGLLLVGLLLYGCGQVDNETGPDQVTGVSVYVAGYHVKNGVYTASCWKDGVISDIGGDYSGATDMTVSGNILYIAGYRYGGGGGNQACYWQNDLDAGVITSANRTDLTGTGTVARAIKTAGNTIYAAGVYNANGSIAQSWENDVKTALGQAGVISHGNDIVVSGNEVYVVGSNNFKACYWKNGVLADLSALSSSALGVGINGNDVYIVGSCSNKACYWKNGVQETLVTVNTSFANDVAFSDTDTYIAGYYINGVHTACYWKNGVKTDLEQAGVDSEARDIFISGSDIYISGYCSDGSTKIACYWKNGVKTDLGPVGEDSYGDAILVVQE